MEIGLSTKRKLGFVKGTIPKPVVLPVRAKNSVARAPNATNIEIWETCNNLVFSWIMSSVYASIAKSVMFISTASEIWSQLETGFSISNGSKKYKLSKDVFGISQQGVSVSAYYTKMKCIWEELDSLFSLPRLTTISPELSVFLTDVERQKEEQRLFQFLNRLDDCYSLQRSQLLLINHLPSVENACAVIQQEDYQKDVFNSGLPVIESTVLLSKIIGKDKCSICGFKWYPPDKCWEKVGYPVWHHKNVLKDMKPEASSGDCTDDELEFVAGMICLNVATNNALFYWRLDTGATDYMTPYCRDMTNAKILEILPKITLPNRDSSEITQIGQVRLQNGIVLKDALCVPTLKFSILFVPKLTKDNNCVAILFPNFCVIQDLGTRKVQGLGRKIGGMHHLLNVPIDHLDAKLKMEVVNSTSLFSCSADAFSRATWTYLTVHKSNALEIIKAFLKFVELQFNTKGCRCVKKMINGCTCAFRWRAQMFSK
nr:cysteine-rich RLK (receptor-like protein kinase) 8 [Tanacetum cinerariifolium]